jgi:ABC-type nitrate/sulfonate/bicarbonate transport system substrate-binding protein
MNGMTNRLKTALVTRGPTKALKEGTVTPRTFEFDFEEVPAIITAFRRMVRSQDFDICEMAMTTYLCARAFGKPFTAIPVFPMRAFHHGAIVYNTRSGIRAPKDLEGKKVGVNRGYTVTTGLWSRSILQHEHGVDLHKITWVLSGDEHVAEYRPPANVVPIESGKTLEQMLENGEIAAAIGIHVDSPDVKPLIPHAKEAAITALSERGLYPINHTVVVRNDVLDANPDLAADLFDALTRAKTIYLKRLLTGTDDTRAGDDQAAIHQRVMDVIRDPLPYGIEANRHMLDAILKYSVEQGILSKPFTVEELFVPSTRTLNA